jgi:Phage protein Gp138 N-terminal domain
VKRQVSLTEVLSAALDTRMLDVHTAIVGRVEQINLTTRKVDVRPAMQRVLQGPDGELSAELLPILPQVPLGALRAGNARIEVPVQVGHWVVVLFFEDNVGKWLAQGGVGVSPGDVERHGMTGAVAVPLLYPDTETNTLPPLSATDIVLAIDGGPELHVTPTTVTVIGNLVVSGSVSAAGQVTAMSATTPVGLSTHLHNTAMGPSGPPNPGT